MRLNSINTQSYCSGENNDSFVEFVVSSEELQKLLTIEGDPRSVDWDIVERHRPMIPGFRGGKAPRSVVDAWNGMMDDYVKYICTNYKSQIDKIIFNPPATILFRDGEKYISKCHENDTYDEEKALAITLLKSFGISYLDLKRMIAKAKRPYLAKDNEKVD